MAAHPYNNLIRATPAEGLPNFCSTSQHFAYLFTTTELSRDSFESRDSSRNISARICRMEIIDARNSRAPQVTAFARPREGEFPYLYMQDFRRERDAIFSCAFLKFRNFLILGILLKWSSKFFSERILNIIRRINTRERERENISFLISNLLFLTKLRVKDFRATSVAR